ncbi:aldose 1-epimerase family protein [Micrococcaceae bacterium Sec5.7]
MNSTPPPLSGHQVRLGHGKYTADIASIGASLRSLRFEDRDLVVPFEPDQVRPAFRGAILAPWPNRVVDGRYSFNGAEHRLSLTEPARGHALHGLVVWEDWTIAVRSDSSATLTCQIPAQDGYPFRLDLQVTYTLDDGGFQTEVTATNTGTGSAPYGTAPHPYLVGGAGPVDGWVLELPARDVLHVTEDRLIPEGVGAVADTPSFDFRTPRLIGSTEIDHAFTGLIRESAGEVRARVTGPDGSGTAMTWGPECPWVQIHTADLPAPAATRVGLAVEPMTCPPDAFNTGTGLIILAPGESHEAQWTIQAITV